MTIIDGIGDEVTYFFITVAVVVIATVAWITTDIQQNFYVRTVYLLEHSGPQTRVTTLTNHTESATISEGLVEVEDTAVGDTEVGVDAEEEIDDDDQSEDPLIEEIIETMDAAAAGEGSTEASILRQRRLQRFQNAGNDTNNPSIISTEETHVEPPPDDTSAAPITIKLKFIDDNLKIVEAQLQELLGDFKRRHFDVELASNKHVRLIFNGQVLKQDQQTLESYGMFDNCVVHCLVQQIRSSTPGEAPSHAETNNVPLGNNSTQTPRDWDLGNLLFVTLTFTLGSIWYFRFQYPQLFTMWTTMGLIGLTSGLGVIALVRYFPEMLAREITVVQ